LKYITYFALFLLFVSVQSFCQETDLSEIIVSIAEDLASDENDPEAVSAYIDRLHELAEEPVRINSADEEELSKLFFLSDFQVKALADYSHSSGKILSVYEIVNIPGFGKETVGMMIPFIILDNNPVERNDSARLHNTLLTNISYRPADRDTSNIGSPVRLLSKYKFVSGSFSGGATIEKDPGEKLFPQKRSLPDFTSCWLAYTGKGVVRKIIIGDFSARFGQGTNINTGMRTALSLTSSNHAAPGSELRPYTSANENNFFRGMAAEFSLGKLGISLFYSSNAIDATTDPSNGHIDNFYSSGLHNNPEMMLRKDAVDLKTTGINLSYNFGNIRTGLLWSEDRLSLPLSENEDPEKIFDFTGGRSTNLSFYYKAVINRIILFGDISVNQACKLAYIQGITLRMSDRLSADLLYRSYGNGYTGLHGNVTGSSTAGQKGSSLLGSFTFEAAEHLFISAGSEIRHYPWLRYRSSSPSMAMRHEVRLKYLPSDQTSFEVLFDHRLTENNGEEETGIPALSPLIYNYVKASARYSPATGLVLGTRIDYKLCNSISGKGMLLLQDASYTFGKVPLTIWLRYCIFSTGGWDSRLYTYENDLLYSFSVPALSGEGSRSYFMVRWKIGQRAEARFKYGVTSLREKNVIGNKEEFKFQMKLFF
jgi:hypothetical protein